MTIPERVRCPCTMFEQDESCPEGYPSMLCGICKGTGNTTQEQVTALAVEMLKIASDVGEAEDPFAAWESIELIKSSGEATSEAEYQRGAEEEFRSHVQQLHRERDWQAMVDISNAFDRDGEV